MLIKRKTTLALVLLICSEFFFNISGYIIHAGLGRILGPEDYGRYSIVVALTTAVVLLFSRGIPTAASRIISAHPEETKSVVFLAAKLQWLIIGTATVLFFFFAPLFAQILGDSTLTPLFRLSSLIIPAFSLAAFNFAYFNGLHAFTAQAIIKIVRSIARIILVLCLGFFYGVTGTIFGYIAAPLLTYVVGWIINILIIIKTLPPQRHTTTTAKKLLAFAGPLTIFMLFYELFLQADLFVIKRVIANDAVVGIYNAALVLARLPVYLTYAITIMLFPAIAKTTLHNQTQKTQKTITNAINLHIIILPLLLVGTIAFAIPAITLFFGSQYTAGAQLLQILAFSGFFIAFFYTGTTILTGAGKAKIVAIMMAAIYIVHTTLSLFTTTYWGTKGTAWTTTIISLMMMLFVTTIIFRYYGTCYSTNVFLSAICATIGAVIFSFFLPLPTGMWTFLGEGALLCIFYGGIFAGVFSLLQSYNTFHKKN